VSYIKEIGARSRTRTGTPIGVRFSYYYSFHCQLALFVVWTIP